MNHLARAQGSRRLAAAISFSLITVGVGAQDTMVGPHGGTSGAAYELRAAAVTRIREVNIHSGGWVDGFSVAWVDRSGQRSGPTPVVGNTTGSLRTFAIPDGDYLARVDVWTTSGFINQMRLVSARGTVAVFGARQTNDTRRNFPAGAQREIVGLFGYAGALVSSVGVITRPVLATSRTEGFDNRCYTSRGTLASLTLAPGSALFIPGSSPQLLIQSLLFVPTYYMIYGASNRTWSGVPLPFDLAATQAPNCFLRASIDVLVPLGRPDIFGRIYHSVNLPNDASLVGGELFLQTLILDAGANPAGLVTTGSVAALIGGI